MWRKVQDHPFYKERREFSKLEAWIDILMEVQHDPEPQDVLFNMTIIKCHYGESLKSLDTWALRWGWDKSKVRRFLSLLKRLNQIHTINERKTTRLTVLNYKDYDPRATLKRHSNDTQTTPDKNEKNVKKEKISTPLNPPKAKSPNLKTYLETKIIEVGFLDGRDKIFEFFNYRQAMVASKRYKTTKAIDGLFRDMIGCKSAGLIISECLDISMERDWLRPSPEYFQTKKLNGFDRKSRSEKNKEACKSFIEGAPDAR